MKNRLLFITFTLLFLGFTASVQAVDLTVAADTPASSNCVPFGAASFGPYKGFAYKDLPAFELAKGDKLAFDLDEPNNVAIQLDIEMATATNGTDEASGPFTKVVSNAQQPADPDGDDIVGNYELAFIAEQPFSFPGGGLIIRFSNPGGEYAADASCQYNTVAGNASDTSGFFVSRFHSDSDGLHPYSNVYTTSIGQFKLSAAFTDYVALGPCRLFDTRQQFEDMIAVNETREFYVWSPGPGDADILAQGGGSNCTVPRNAVAVQINLTAVDPLAFGYLRAWRTGTTPPNATLMTWPSAGVSISNTTSVPLNNSMGKNLSVKVYAGSTHLVGDVVGYYVVRPLFVN